MLRSRVQNGIFLTLALVCLVWPDAATAEGHTGFYQQPAFHPFRAALDFGPVRPPGWSNDFVQPGFNVSADGSDSGTQTQKDCGVTANLAVANALRLAVGYMPADRFRVVDHAIELVVGAGYSFTKTDLGVQAEYVHNFATCDSGGVPSGYGLAGFLVQRVGSLTLEVSGGVQLYSLGYLCAYEGGPWGVIDLRSRVGLQIAANWGAALQLEVLAGKVDPLFLPKSEVVYSVPFDRVTLDLSGTLGLGIGGWSAPTMGVGAAVRFE